MTRHAPTAASKIPIMNSGRTALHPFSGGWDRVATTAFTIGAPAKTMDMTTAGLPPAPNASNTPKAPIAPTTPARKDHDTPLLVNDHAAPLISSNTAEPITATNRYASPTNRKDLYRLMSLS